MRLRRIQQYCCGDVAVAAKDADSSFSIPNPLRVRTWRSTPTIRQPKPTLRARARTPNAKRPVSTLNPLRWRNTATRRYPNPKFEDEDDDENENDDEAPGEERRLTRAQTTYRSYRAIRTRAVSSSQSRMRFDTREQTPGVSGPDKGYRGT